MKSFIKQIIIKKLSILAKVILLRHKPFVIVIAGSVGKTSTKDAIYQVLHDAGFSVRKSEKSYNSEIGLPLTVIGAENPWSSIIGWIEVIIKGLSVAFLPQNNYPKYLVLETGVGKKGDMAHLANIVQPDIAILTNLPDTPVHVEFFASREDLWKEEAALFLATKPQGICIANANDKNSKHVIADALSTYAQRKIVWYGEGEHSSVTRSSYIYTQNKENLPCIRAVFTVDGVEYPGLFSYVIAPYLLDSFLPALHIATVLGIDIASAIKSLEEFIPPPGRMHPFYGINESIIIDDTYNSSPIASEKALEVLAELPLAGRRIAVLGDMLELGEYTKEAHQKIGAHAAQNADVVIFVGLRSHSAYDGAMETAPQKDLHYVLHLDDILETFPHEVQKGDIVLVKGSQGMRMEKLVKKLLANQNDAQYLCRQEEEWEKR